MKKKAIEYIDMKIEMLRKNKEQMLDKMLELKIFEDDKLYREEYLKYLYAYEQLLDIKAFIETGEILDERFKERK